IDDRLRGPGGLDGRFLLSPFADPPDAEPQHGAANPTSDRHADDPLGPDRGSRKAVLELAEIGLQPGPGGLDLPYRFSCAFAHSTSSLTVRTVSSGFIGGRLTFLSVTRPATAAMSMNPPATMRRDAHGRTTLSRAAAAASARNTNTNSPMRPAPAAAPAAISRAVTAWTISCRASSASFLTSV